MTRLLPTRAGAPVPVAAGTCATDVRVRSVEWRGLKPLSPWLTMVALSGSWACAANTSDSSEAETPAKAYYALVSVQRSRAERPASPSALLSSEEPDSAPLTSGTALVALVEAPAAVSAEQVLDTTGLSLSWPRVGSCQIDSQKLDRRALVRWPFPVELHEADLVRLRLGTIEELLPPRAYPQAPEVARGAIHTSRQVSFFQAEGDEPLETQIEAEAFGSLVGLKSRSWKLSGETAPALENLRLNGQDLNAREQLRVSSQGKLKLSWTPGSSKLNAQLRVKLAVEDSSFSCSFEDSAGEVELDIRRYLLELGPASVNRDADPSPLVLDLAVHRELRQREELEGKLKLELRSDYVFSTTLLLEPKE